jgi:hypothetical protein
MMATTLKRLTGPTPLPRPCLERASARIPELGPVIVRSTSSWQTSCVVAGLHEARPRLGSRPRTVSPAMVGLLSSYGLPLTFGIPPALYERPGPNGGVHAPKVTGRSLGLVLVSIFTHGVPDAQAQAQVLTTVSNVDADFEVLACSGEIVAVSAVFHIISHSTTDASGGFHFSSAGTGVNVRGVGASGTRYRFSGGNFSASNTNGGAGFEFTSVVRFDVISSGGSPNSELFGAFMEPSTPAEPTADVPLPQQMLKTACS